MNHNETGQQPYTKVSLVFKFLYGSKRYFLISIAAALCVTGVDMLSPQLIRTTVDGILGENALQLPGFLVDLVERIGGVGYLREHLWLIGGLLVLLALLSVTFRYLFILFNAKGAESLAETMRNCLFSHIQRLPFAWHMQNQTGDIIQRCTSDVDMVKNFISEQLTSVFRIVILIILSLLFMFSMNAKLTMVALASIPIIIAYSTYFHSKISSQFMKCDENEGILSTIAQENLTGVRVVRAFGREKYEKDRFEKQNNIYTNLWIRLCRLLALFWGAGDLISGLQVMLIVIFGSVFCVRGSMTAGEFIAFISYNAMLTWPVRSLGRMIAEMSKAGVSIERIRYIMNSPVEQDKPDAVTPDMNGDIAFENVTFAYADTPILSDISFRIPQGTTFGILGGTGSAKSSFAALIPRLYDATRGEVRVGGIPVKDYDMASLRDNVAMVLQKNVLFSGTIKENLRWGKEDATDEEIVRACRLAQADEFIRDFPAGYDTRMERGGANVSGGQKQRLCIARALLKKPKILILDDSTSAVDTKTDALIRRAFREEIPDTTKIVIAQRISSIQDADRILVFDNGRMEAAGTHEELLGSCPVYREIYESQTKEGGDDESGK